MLPATQWAVCTLTDITAATVARAEAHEDVMNADYKVAITKCNALASDAEDACVAAAKTKFNK